MRTIKKLIIGLAILAASITGMHADDRHYTARVKIQPPATVTDFSSWRPWPNDTKEVSYIGVDAWRNPRGNEINNIVVDINNMWNFRDNSASRIYKVTIPSDIERLHQIKLSDMPNLSVVVIPDGQQFKELMVYKGAGSIGGTDSISRLKVQVGLDNNGFTFIRPEGFFMLSPDPLIVPPAEQAIIGKTPDQSGRYRINYVLPGSNSGLLTTPEGLLVLEVRTNHVPPPTPISKIPESTEITIRHGRQDEIETGSPFVIDFLYHRSVILQKKDTITDEWRDIGWKGGIRENITKSKQGFFRIKPQE